MHKGLYWVVGIWLVLAYFLMGSDRAKAQTTVFNAPDGRMLGTATTMGNYTTYTNSSGQSVGYTTTTGNYTTYNNPNGQQIGNAYTLPSSNQAPQPQPFFNGVPQR